MPNLSEHAPSPRWRTLKAILQAGALTTIAATCLPAHTSAAKCLSESEPSPWLSAPAYITDPRKDSSLAIKDTDGLEHLVYCASNAILIFQSQYESYNDYPAIATRNEKALVSALETAGFNVIVWRDLSSKQLKRTLDDAFDYYGAISGSRLFFYFYGHGVEFPSTNQHEASAYLVPIDAPQQNDPTFKLRAFH
jgi:hypothetical protein